MTNIDNIFQLLENIQQTSNTYYFNSYYDNYSANTQTLTCLAGTSYFKIPTSAVAYDGDLTQWDIIPAYPNDVCLRYIGETSAKYSQHIITIGYRTDIANVGEFCVLRSPTLNGAKFIDNGIQMIDSISKKTNSAGSYNNMTIQFYDNECVNGSTYFLAWRHNTGSSVVFTLDNFSWRLYSHYN